MQKGLLSCETGKVNNCSTSSSLSSSSEIDLLNLHVRNVDSNAKRRNRKNRSISSGSSYCIFEGQGLESASKSGSGYGRKSRSVHSVVSDLSQARRICSLPINFINEQVTFGDKRNITKAAERNNEIVTNFYKTRSEHVRRSPRTHIPSLRQGKQECFKAEKGTQAQLGLDQRGEGSLSDTDRSTKDTYHLHYTTSARPALSFDNIGSPRSQNQCSHRRSPRIHQQYLHSDRHKTKHRMAQHSSSPRTSSQDYEKFTVEGQPNLESEKESDESKRVFPFQATPSGNLKIVPNQVVFESKKVSVLVADPRHTKVNVKAELGSKGFLSEKKSSFQGLNPSDSGEHFCKMADGENTTELELSKLGFKRSAPIDWTKVTLPSKSELHKLLHHHITNRINPDCIVHIGNEEFKCHHLVLQCYSSYFDKEHCRDADLPETSVSPKAFSIIYDWMIHPGNDSYQLLRRDNILEVFLAAHFLSVKELEEQCWAFIDSEEMFSEDTAFLLYLEAKKIGHTAVMDLMIPRISKFFLTLVSTKDFLDLSVDELCVILKSNYICVHCEIEVFMSAVRWLMSNWEVRQKYLTEVMSCIRFGLIEPWQLVDIRRNPENPEFVEISSSQQVQQLVEDGLAYAIIKYWYGNQTQDYYHWIDLLGLTEPTPRNCFEEEKKYETYREFLKDLDGYRKGQGLDKKKSKSRKSCPLRSLESQALPSMVPESHGLNPKSRPLSMLPPGLTSLITPSSNHQNKGGQTHHVGDHPPSVTEFFNRRDCVSNRNLRSTSHTQNVNPSKAVHHHRSASFLSSRDRPKTTGNGDEP